jgi:hypothetical protein
MDLTIVEHRLQRIENLLINQKTVLTFNEAAEFTGLSKKHFVQANLNRWYTMLLAGGEKTLFQ